MRFLIVSLFCSIFILSCKTDRIPLSQIENIIWLHTDSAYHLLPSQLNLFSEKEEAILTLYRTICLRRLGKPLDNDTVIQSAIHYFSSSNDLAHYYILSVQWGCILVSRDSLSSAMQVFKEIGHLDNKNYCNFSHSLYHSHLGYLYRQSRDYNQSFYHYQLAFDQSKELNYSDWIVSNGLSLLNLPIHSSQIDYRKFGDNLINEFSAYLPHSDSVITSKAYTNIAKYYESFQDIYSAFEYSDKAVRFGQLPENYRSYLNHARLCDKLNLPALADSCYAIVNQCADPIILHRAYRHLFRRALNNSKYSAADSLLTAYVYTIDSLYEHRDKSEIQEISARYDLRTTELHHEKQRTVLLLILLFLIVVLLATYLIYRINGYYKYKKLKAHLLFYYSLIQEKNNLSNDKNAELDNRMRELSNHISCLSKELNRYKILFNVRSMHHLLHQEDLSALNLFLHFSSDSFHYISSLHKNQLFHWMNLVENNFVAHLIQKHPTLTIREIELCCFYRLGYDNNRIADLLRVSPDTIRRNLIKIYHPLHVSNKSSFLTYIGGI